jgi:hypothetical protein
MQHVVLIEVSLMDPAATIYGREAKTSTLTANRRRSWRVTCSESITWSAYYIFVTGEPRSWRLDF